MNAMDGAARPTTPVHQGSGIRWDILDGAHIQGCKHCLPGLHAPFASTGHPPTSTYSLLGWRAGGGGSRPPTSSWSQPCALSLRLYGTSPHAFSDQHRAADVLLCRALPGRRAGSGWPDGRCQ